MPHSEDMYPGISGPERDDDFGETAAESRIVIDLGAVANNTEAMRRCLASGVELIAVVKANAYGHGATAVRQYNGTCFGKPLKRVEVAGMLVNDRFLAAMPGLDSLEDLRIQRCKLSDSGLENLKKFPMLRTLSLADDIGITVEGIRHLTNLTHLVTVNLTGTGLDPSIAPALSAMPELLHLYADPGHDWSGALMRAGATNITVMLSRGAPRPRPAAIGGFQ